MKPLFLLVAFSLVASSFAANAKMSNVRLYQPDGIMKERVGDVTQLAAFILKIQLACDESFTSEEKEGVDVVVILKPGGKSRVWFVSSLATKPDRARLKVAIEAIRPPSVSGPVVFALAFDLNGFSRPAREPEKSQPPVPVEWTERVKNAQELVMNPDGLVPHVWPDEKA